MHFTFSIKVHGAAVKLCMEKTFYFILQEGFKGDTNSSSPAYFAQWFHNEAVKIAKSFDKRNGTDFYMKDLSRAYL